MEISEGRFCERSIKGLLEVSSVGLVVKTSFTILFYKEVPRTSIGTFFKMHVAKRECLQFDPLSRR